MGTTGNIVSKMMTKNFSHLFSSFYFGCVKEMRLLVPLSKNISMKIRLSEKFWCYYIFCLLFPMKAPSFLCLLSNKYVNFSWNLILDFNSSKHLSQCPPFCGPLYGSFWSLLKKAMVKGILLLVLKPSFRKKGDFRLSQHTFSHG